MQLPLLLLLHSQCNQNPKKKGKGRGNKREDDKQHLLVTAGLYSI